ncbi:Crp/Fnr family transcriptional regulator [Mesorhizobium sp. CO1-1-8]|uniref:Crp/Fnr family transcriptional regulator n=1 Tax=Mesorhizobium sp. CO1-1-8 TaxID=2876631 RepID=UPI001CD0E7FA|nr:Crp/Fnr family transcriptional regulator [Mesorhizobium sp. CO1-1-8]MBZ9774988.1 Crp/Fnr family transcriptional regulator [Mesorhizobium sp. CO1-1-8]
MTTDGCCTALIRKLEHFKKLSDEDKELLANSVAKTVEFGPGSDIITQGDQPDYVHLLVDGWAGRYKLLQDGGRNIMAFLIPGDLCDVNVALLEEMDHSIGALSACKVALIPLATIRTLMDENRTLARALWWGTLVDEAVLREWLVTVGSRPAQQRVGHLICEMLIRTDAVGLASGNSFDLPLSQQELADTMGMSLVHMNRTLQALRSRELITTNGHKVMVDNLRALTKFTAFDPLYLHQQAHKFRSLMQPKVL